MKAMARTIGRFIPRNRVGSDPTDKFIINQQSVGGTWYNIGSAALTPQRVRLILDEAERGKLSELYKLYERMESTDTRYGGIVSQIESTISGLPTKVVPPVTLSAQDAAIAEDYAEVIREAYEHINIHHLVKAFSAPYLYGAMLYRMKWAQHEYSYGKRIWFPEKIQRVSLHNVGMDTNPESDTYGQFTIATKDNPEGVPLSNLHYSSYVFLEDGDVEGRYDKIGVARKIVPWYVGVQFVQGWWLQYIEGYGAPMRIGRYPQGAGTRSKNEMEKFLRVLGQHGYAIFPQEMEVQLLEANRQGTITTYSDFIKKAHDEYAIAMLGQSDTMGDRRNGSFARAQVTNDVRIDIVANVASIIEDGFRQLNNKIIRANYGDNYQRRLVPRIDLVVIKPADMDHKARATKLAQDNGIPIPVDYWYEQILGAPKPRDGERSILNGQEFLYGVEAPPNVRHTDRPTESDESPGSGAGMERGATDDDRGSSSEDAEV